MSTVAKTNSRELHSNIAMTVTLISFGMLFATLFLGYAIFRVSYSVWPPMGMEKIPLSYTILSTFLVLLSSINYYLFEKSQKRILLWTTFFLGLLFLGSQLNTWNFMLENEILAENGIFPSMIYAFTAIHAAHMLAAILGLAWLLWITRKNIQPKNLVMKNVGMFWHFLGVVWLVMFFTLFVL